METKLPSPTFRNVSQLDRIRAMMLGQPIKKYGRTIPWGYKLSASNPEYLLPIDEDLRLLVKAKHIIQDRQRSYSEVSEWLSAQTGRSLTPPGLHEIFKKRAPDDRVFLSLDERMKL